MTLQEAIGICVSCTEAMPTEVLPGRQIVLDNLASMSESELAEFLVCYQFDSDIFACMYPDFCPLHSE